LRAYQFTYVAAVDAGIALCLLRDMLPKKYGGYVPSPMAMGIPFYIGANSVRQRVATKRLIQMKK